MTRADYPLAEKADVEAIDALRNQFKAALISGKPEDLAPLITDDYVYYQPNYEGPCTYGRQPHLAYIRSLPNVYAVEIKLMDFVLMDRWAFETGEEVYQEGDGQGGRIEQVARFARLSYRGDDGYWRMARTFRGTARDLHSFRLPPRAEFVCNSGKGHWQPMPIDIECLHETKYLVAADKEGLRQLMRDGDPTTITLAQSVKMDPSHMFVSTQGNYTWQQYEDYQHNVNQKEYQYDEIHKYNEDARVMVPGKWGYTMGKGTGIAVSLATGVRRSGLQFYFYLWQRIDAGRDPWPWKMHSSFSCDVLTPISPRLDDYPGKSSVIKAMLREKWSQQAGAGENPLRRYLKS